MHKKLSITTTEFEKKNAVRNENVDLRGSRRDAIQNMKLIYKMGKWKPLDSMVSTTKYLRGFVPLCKKT